MKNKNNYLTTGAHIIECDPCNYFTLLDSKGNVYYTRDIDGAKKVKVNIHHPDNYSANTPFKVVSTGAIQKGRVIPLPDAERFRLKQIKIVFNPNLHGTPARIFTEKHPAIIEVGKKFYSLPKFARAFILYHEYGHLFFKTEWKTDQFALRIFLAQGFNPSQAFYALSKVLGRSPQNAKRILNLFDNLKNHNYVSGKN